MKISGICFTQSGRKLAEHVNALLLNDTWEEQISTEWYCKGRRFQKDGSMFHIVTEPMHEWSGKRFKDSDVIIFIGAAGIAVRGIAPHVRDKRYDPAVIVIDEQGKFCISLLSGHIGGANEMVRRLSGRMGSVPVITTATDVNDLFAVDEYAARNNMTISSMTYAKEVSAALLSGDPVGFWTGFSVKGELPEGIVWADKLEKARADRTGRGDEGVSLGFYISPSFSRVDFDHALWLIPKCLVIGIGCRRDTPVSKIEKLVNNVLWENGLFTEAIASVASIDLKKDEPGLIEFCKRMEVPFHTFSAEQLQSLEGSFTPSEFVEKTTGVDNVCERSAVMDGGGKLIIRKTGEDGVTCAVALLDLNIEF